MAADDPLSGQNPELVREYVERALIHKPEDGHDPSILAAFIRDFAKFRVKMEREPNEENVFMFVNTLGAMSNCVSLLKQSTLEKVSREILLIRLWESPEVVRLAVLRLLTDMASVNSEAVEPIAQHLRQFLLPPSTRPAASDAPPPVSDEGPWQPVQEQLSTAAQIASTLAEVLVHVPTSPAAVLQKLAMGVPHKLRDRNVQCLYLTAMFIIAESPGGWPIRDGLLAAALEHILTIDVEIQWKSIEDKPKGADAPAEGEGKEEEEGVKEEQEPPAPQLTDAELEDLFATHAMSELDINAPPGTHQPRPHPQPQPQAQHRSGFEGAAAALHLGASAQASNTQTADVAAADTLPEGVVLSLEEQKRLADEKKKEEERKALELLANKLDSIMEIVFAYLGKRCSDPGGVESTWHALIGIFDRTILNTYRSKFTQFVLFYMASKFPEPCARLFIDHLLDKLQDLRQPPITRRASAAYLASFLARATVVSGAQVLHALTLIVQVCHHYCSTTSAVVRSQSSGSIRLAARPPRGPGSQQSLRLPDKQTTLHDVFIGCVQALMYVLCYHMEHMLGTNPQQPSQMAAKVKSLVLQGVMPLLRHPSRPLNACNPVVIEEFRSQLAALGMTDFPAYTPLVKDPKDKSEKEELDMFFPFDPYLLERSANYLDLDHSYVTWASRHEHAYASDDDEEDGEDGDLELDDESEASSSDAESSDDDEDESLRGGSVPSDSMLGRPAIKVLKRGGAAMAGGSRAPAGRQRTRGGADAMATSVSPGAMGGYTPAGTSPMVDYLGMSVGMASSGAGGSPMQMTPIEHHMAAAYSRFGAARR